MIISKIMKKMIDFSEGNVHDIDHFIRVWTYAKTIGELEEIEHETQKSLEIAAIVHDIACPLCRKKYGNTNAKLQEEEGAQIAREFLSEFELSAEQIDRISYLVGHHHTYSNIDGMDYQILIEADYIANASEKGYSRTDIESFMHKIMKTEGGKRILEAVFSL